MRKQEILILGDSYASESGDGTWPFYLGQLLNADITCYGLAGASNYGSLRVFERNYGAHYDYIIVALTSHTRYPVVNDYPYLCSFAPTHPRFDHFENMPAGFREAVVGYLKFFYDDKLAKWISVNVMKDIANRLTPTQKVIWLDGLLCSEKYNIDVSNVPGIHVKGTLTDISIKLELEEMLQIDPYKLMEEIGKTGNDPRKNHLTVENQKVLAVFLHKLINKLNAGETLSDDDLDLKKAEWNREPHLVKAEMFPDRKED